jgi:hypothetical protein
VRSGFEQFRYQVSPVEEVSRTRAHYLDAASHVPEAPLLSAQAWEVALGCPLDQFVQTGFLLHVWAAEQRCVGALCRVGEPTDRSHEVSRPYAARSRNLHEVVVTTV